MKGAWFFPVATLLGALCLGACESSSDATEEAPTCAPVHVERFKELVVVDEGVLADARAKNATSGVWSFRHAVENMAPAGTDASEFVRAWLRDWVETENVNGYALERPGVDRKTEMNAQIICPWIKRTPANGCEPSDNTCGSCSGQKLDLAVAPFRLIGIVNRMDLRDEVEGEPAGEGRLVFAAANGSGDDAASPPLRMSVNFEYRLPDARSVAEWANTWHALGQFAALDEPFRAALEGVTNGFTKRGASPAAVNGSAIGQIRTNESVMDWAWQLREFGLDASGSMRPRALRNTPPQALNNSGVLTDFVTANAKAIQSDKFEMPVALRGGSVDKVPFTWSVPGTDETTRKAFATNTCNGCHFGEQASIDGALHISPLRSGIDSLSPFMNSPNGGPDQLTLRSSSLQKALCAR